MPRNRLRRPLQQLPASEGHPVVRVPQHRRNQEQAKIHAQCLCETLELRVELRLMLLHVACREAVGILEDLEEAVHLQVWRDEEDMVKRGLEAAPCLRLKASKGVKQCRALGIVAQTSLEGSLGIHPPVQQLLRSALSQEPPGEVRCQPHAELRIVKSLDGPAQAQPASTSVGVGQVISGVEESCPTVELHSLGETAVGVGCIPFLSKQLRPLHLCSAGRSTGVVQGREQDALWLHRLLVLAGQHELNQGVGGSPIGA
mmetsp:Transcript_18325/g.40159  ORF Transcript_18325/g.40159 Transcript_18325/m.40159 type:complete len:258 (-) Transcript_18325:107-880(-)